MMFETPAKLTLLDMQMTILLTHALEIQRMC